ncbi:MAG TPA: CPBP family glutamic-type intramembrane protease, partial [Actinomycetota bacterium]|nr:CPBP family glutamic-type intramembrane protease [Actinomycetota bacterium]
SGVTLGALAIIGLSHFRLWDQLGFRRPERWRDLLMFAPFVLLGLAPLSAGVQAAPGTLVAWAIAALLIAFYKMVRLGGLLYALEPRGRWKAASLAALTFALFELGGVLAGGRLAATGLLSVMYFFLSFAYGAVWLRTGTIWPLIIANALMTISAAATQRSVEASNLASSVPEMVSGIVVAILLAAYGAFLMRKPSRSTDRSGTVTG